MGSRAWVHNGGYCFDNVDNRSPLWERRQPRALAPSPAKAGGEGARLRATGSRADERTPAVLAGRTGWGGVSSRSARTVRPPSQPPPALAGGGAQARAPGQSRPYRSWAGPARPARRLTDVPVRLVSGQAAQPTGVGA